MSLAPSEHPRVQALLEESRTEVLRLLLPGGCAGLGVLDLGCGAGDFLALLVAQGAEERFTLGLDADAERLALARRRFPAATFREQRLEDFEVEDGSFDLVVLSQVMSQIPDPEDRRALLARAASALAPGGRILVHDMLRLRPRSRSRGLRRFGPVDLAALMPSGLQVRAFRRCTLYPPILRLVAPRAPGLARRLGRVPALLGHWMALLEIEAKR